MQIIIKNMDLTFDVEPSLTVLQLKGLIEEKLDVLVSEQRLTLSGKQLQDHHTLEEERLADQTAIQLIVRRAAITHPDKFHSWLIKMKKLTVDEFGIIHPNEQKQVMNEFSLSLTVIYFGIGSQSKFPRRFCPISDKSG
jgi:hypothetical protein